MRLGRKLTTVALGGAFALMTAAAPTVFAQAKNPGAAVNSVTGSGNGSGSPGTNGPTVKINGPYSPTHPYEGNDLVNREATGKRPLKNMWTESQRSKQKHHKVKPKVGNGRPDSYFVGNRPLTAHPSAHPGGQGVTPRSNMTID
jgi:hypothetical protein